MRWGPEVRAAAVLLGVALLGTAVRSCPGGRHTPGAVWAVGEARPSRDTLAAASARLARPLQPGERLDVNRADAADLARLPRVGPALAARIVATRDSAGPFRSLEALGRVPGIGPATMAGLRPHVTLSDASGPALVSPVPINRATAAELQALPGIGPALAAAIVADRADRGPFRSPAELTRVRGIGPALLARLEGRILLP